MDKSERYPEIVYKYRAWDGYGKNLLTDFELYLASPKDFNDPFDCKIPTNYKLLNDQERIKFVDELVERHKQSLLQKGIDPEIEKKRLHYKISDIDKFQKDYELISFEENDKRYGVLSFATNWDNILMWSHYGGFHNGYCVGLDCRQLINLNLFGSGGGMQYSSMNEYPKIHPFDKKDNIETIFKNTHYKALNWSYEEEYRFTKFFYPEEPEVEDRKIKISPNIVSDVTIGLRTPEDHKEEIIKICKENGIKVFQAKQVEFRFKLDRDPI